MSEEPWEDLDGWRRNAAKFRSDWHLWQVGMAPHWKRLRRDRDTHAYVNLYVESFRLTPYLWGHVAAVLLPIFLILTFI